MEIQQTIQSSFQTQIQISKEAVSRAIYFHGYLFEQTTQIFDISRFETFRTIIKQKIGVNLQTALSRQILLLPKIIILKDDLYSSNGRKSIISHFALF